MPDPNTKQLPFAVLAQRLVHAITFVLILVLLYVEIATAYVNTQEAIRAKASADNASSKQHAEAILLREQAKTALEAARNASVRHKADAEATEAEADKIEAEGQTLKEKAIVADRKARADAFTIVNEAKLRRANLTAGLAELRNVARKEKAQVEELEGKALMSWTVARAF